MSDYMTESVLSVEYKDERQKPVAYLFQLLSETKQKYEIHDKEILVVIKSLEN